MDSDGRQRGVLTEWNDERGFGFVVPTAGGPRAFVHVSAFPRGRRPRAGCEVTYVEQRDERGRPRGSDVQYLRAGRARRPTGRGTPAALVVATLFLGVLGVLVLLQELPVLVFALYGLLSGVAVLAYRLDKSAAERGGWRTAESTLHAVALLGGWPGALVARHAFRHKTVKQPFRTVFWFTVVANCAALAWLVHSASLHLLWE